MFNPTFERRFSLTMLIVDSSLAALVAKTAYQAVRTGPRRYAVRMVAIAGVSTAVAIWRVFEHRDLLENQRLDQLLFDSLEDDDDELEDDEAGWIFDDEHFSGSDIDQIIKAQVHQRHYPLMTVAPPPEQMMSTFYLPDDEDDGA